MNPTETSHAINLGQIARLLGCEIDEIDAKLRSMSNETDEQYAARWERTNRIIDDIRAVLTPEALANPWKIAEEMYDPETGLPV